MDMRNRLAKLLFLSAMARRNLWRYPTRSVLTIIALAGGLTIVIFYSALISGMTKQMVSQATEVSTGYIQIHSKVFAEESDLYALLPDETTGILQNELNSYTFSPRLYAFALASSDSLSSGVQLRAIDPNIEPGVSVLGTKNLTSSVESPLLNSKKARAVVVGNKLARQLELAVGSELILVTQAADGSIGNDLFSIEGISKSVDPVFDRMGVLMRIEDYRELMVLPNGVHEIAVRINAENLDQAKADIMDVLNANKSSDSASSEIVVRTWRELNPAISDMLELQSAVVGYVGLAVMFMASFGVLNTILMSIFERKYEFGVMRSVGIRARHIIMMVIIETGILTLVAGFLGNVCGYALSEYYREDGIDLSSMMPDGYDWAGMSIEPYLKSDFQWLAVQQSNLIMIVVVIIATVYPLLKTVRKRPVELLS